jgi:glutamine synthetase
MAAALGDEFMHGYARLKLEDWNAYSRHLTAWERDTTLNC